MAENFVKVAILGNKVVEVCLEDDATLQDALDAAEVDDVEGMEIKINKRPAKVEDKVFGGDIVVLVPKIEGGL